MHGTVTMTYEWPSRGVPSVAVAPPRGPPVTRARCWRAQNEWVVVCRSGGGGDDDDGGGPGGSGGGGGGGTVFDNVDLSEDWSEYGRAAHACWGYYLAAWRANWGMHLLYDAQIGVCVCRILGAPIGIVYLSYDARNGICMFRMARELGCAFDVSCAGMTRMARSRCSSRPRPRVSAPRGRAAAVAAEVAGAGAAAIRGGPGPRAPRRRGALGV